VSNGGVKLIQNFWHTDAVFDQLHGSWLLDRRIGEEATMRGTAKFEWYQQGHLSYKESGRFVLKSGTSHEAYRSYIYSRLPNGFRVWFDEPEPRLFHEVHLNQVGDSLLGKAIHNCGSDEYETHYRFSPNASFCITHYVKGPKKNYVSITEFVREQNVAT